MKYTYSKEVAAYLNNKFGDDFTMTEPYPYWMKAPDQKEDVEPECWQEPDRPMTATEYKCWHDCLLDLEQEILEAIEEDN